MGWSGVYLSSSKALKRTFSLCALTASECDQITALALGISLITVLSVLRVDLLERWQEQLPEGTPNQFVYGLPPFDMPQLQQQLTQNGWKSTPLYPNIRGRLVAKTIAPLRPNKSNKTMHFAVN